MTSNENFELDTPSICELVGKRVRILYREERNGTVTAVNRDKKLIALDYSANQQVNHYIFSDGVLHFKVASTQMVTMIQL